MSGRAYENVSSQGGGSSYRRLAQELVLNLREIEGKSCWGIAAGANTGSVLNLHFGAKLPRRRPIPNPKLCPDLRRYDGELSILVDCAWRIETPKRVLCGWLECDGRVNPLEIGVEKLVHRVVTGTECHLPSCDLAFSFDNGMTLRLFCDRTVRESTNFSLFGLRYCYTVSTNSSISRQRRHSAFP